MDTKLDNNRIIVLSNGFKVQHLNKFILNIINNRKSENEFNSQEFKLSTQQYFIGLVEQIKLQQNKLNSTRGKYINNSIKLRFFV